MKNRNLIKISTLALSVAACAVFTLTGCASSAAKNTETAEAAIEAAPLPTTAITSARPNNTGEAVVAETLSAAISETEAEDLSGVSGGVFDASELFSGRDLEQTPDLADAVYYPVSDGKDIHITEAGVYVLSGTANNATVYVEAGDEDKVQLVLDGVSITNDDFPCVYVTSADKVFVTTVADSELSVTGAFRADGDTNIDGVIFSRSDLTLNGTAALTISSTDNGVVSKDDLKVTGGTYTVTAASKCFEAHDSIRIADGVFVLTADTDALHAEYDEDDTVGYIYIGGGDFTIKAGDITVVMSSGDTDGIDCNGDLIITGGTINVTGNSTFDIDGSKTYTGGTIIVNGQQVDSIPAGFGGMGGRGGKGNRWG